jgi:hypothetical protein
MVIESAKAAYTVKYLKKLLKLRGESLRSNDCHGKQSLNSFV